MELVEGGNLLENLANSQELNIKWSVSDISKLLKQILLPLNYMHNQGVVHRDLKLENVMVDFQINEDGQTELVCKLTDFGLSCILEPGKTASNRVGTPLYQAPEIVQSVRYDGKVDTWAFGVLAYVLFGNYTYPFEGQSVEEVRESIRSQQPDWSVMDRYVEKDKIVDFLSHCLDKNPATRFSVEELLNHELISGVVSDALL